MRTKQSNLKPKTVSFIEPTTGRAVEAQRRVFDAIALKRRNPHITLSEAAKRSGTTVGTVKRYAPSVVNIRNGRLDVTATDRITRHLQMLTHKGYVPITVRNSRDASRIAKYNNAVRTYLMTGDFNVLKQYAGKRVRAGGVTYDFITEKLMLERLVRAGAVHSLDIYSVGGLA